MRKKTLEEAMLEHQKDSANREKKSREAREAVIPSFEVVFGEAGDPKVHQHVYGRRNPEHIYVLKEVLGYLPGDADITHVGPKRFISLLEKSAEKASGYLIRKFRNLDPEETLDFTTELREGLYNLRADKKSLLFI